MTAKLEHLALFSGKIRDSSPKRFEQVPDGQENIRLLPDAMSMADLLVHLIQSDKVLFSILKTKHIPENRGQPQLAKTIERAEYDPLLHEFRQRKGMGHQFIVGLSEEQLQTNITSKRMGGLTTMPLLEALYGFLDHEIHHHSKLALYLNHLSI